MSKFVTTGLMAVLVLVALSMLTGPALAQDPLTPVERAWVEQHGPVVVGCFVNYPPLGFLDQQGRPVGISVDYWKQLAIDLDLLLQFEPAPIADQIAGLGSGRFDSLAGIFPLPQRARHLSFTKPWFFINTYIFVSPQFKERVRSLNDLHGLKVGVIQGDSAQDLAVNAGLKTIGYSEYPQAVMALAQGQLDAIIMDEPVVFYLRGLHRLWESIVRVGPPVAKGRITLPVRKNDIMLYSILSKGAARIPPADVDRISKKWRLLDTPGATRKVARPLPHMQ